CRLPRAKQLRGLARFGTASARCRLAWHNLSEHATRRWNVPVMFSAGTRNECAEREDLQVHVEGQVGTRDFCHLKRPKSSGPQARCASVMFVFGCEPCRRGSP